MDPHTWPSKSKTTISKLYVDTWCSPDGRLEAMDDREGWREKVTDIRADGATWWSSSSSSLFMYIILILIINLLFIIYVNNANHDFLLFWYMMLIIIINYYSSFMDIMLIIIIYLLFIPIKWNAVSSRQRLYRYCYMDRTTWTLTKRLEKKLDGNYTRILKAILNKSWRQHPTRHQLYGHLPPITKNIQVRRTRHAGHCWRSKDELISDVLLWTPTYGQAKAGRPARTYIQQLCEDTGCNPEDLPEAMNNREKWRERARDIRAGGTTWGWWWWWWFIIHFFLCI